MRLNASAQSWVLKARVVAEQRPMSINADANAKLNHYRHSGSTITEAYKAGKVEPLLRSYFAGGGEVLDRLQQQSCSTPVDGSSSAGERIDENHVFSCLCCIFASDNHLSACASSVVCGPQPAECPL